MTSFAEPNMRPIPEHLDDLLVMYTVLPLQLLDDVLYPDEASDSQPIRLRISYPGRAFFQAIYLGIILPWPCLCRARGEPHHGHRRLYEKPAKQTTLMYAFLFDLAGITE